VKILHLCGGKLSGGAAKGALLLHTELSAQGYESFFITEDTKFKPDDTSFIRLPKISLTILLKYLISKCASKLWLLLNLRASGKYFSKVGSLVKLENIPDIKGYDVVFVHWLGPGFVNIEKSETLPPTYFVARDMRFLTNGCHYPISCQTIKDDCANCPFMRLTTFRNQYDMTAYQKIFFISEYLKNFANDLHFNTSNDVVIGNCIDETYWKASSKVKSKSLNKTIIGLGCLDLTDPYKKILNTLELLKSLPAAEYQIMLFGKNSHELEILDSKNINFVGPLSSDELVSFYQKIDIFINLSEQDAFGKVFVEALSQGTPVIGLKNSGASDIIVDYKSGRLIGNANAELLSSIDEIVDEYDSYTTFIASCRDEIREKFSASIVLKNIMSNL